MTIREVLARVDTIRPNAYTDGEKIAMLNTIEGRIYADILEQAEGFDKEFLPFRGGAGAYGSRSFYRCIPLLSGGYD